jgi:hypothetical protein
VYDLIKKDLGFAIENLPLASAILVLKSVVPQKVTTLLGKVYLTLGDKTSHDKCIEGCVQ